MRPRTLRAIHPVYPRTPLRKKEKPSPGGTEEGIHLHIGKQGSLLISQAFACWNWHRPPNGVRCRGVIGPVPQPLLIRIKIVWGDVWRKIKSPFIKKRTELIKFASSHLSSIACWIWHRAPTGSPLPRCHRASPSTSLDKKVQHIRFSNFLCPTLPPKNLKVKHFKQLNFLGA